MIDEFTTRTGMHVSPGVIVPDGKDEETMKIGDRWRVGYDETRYFRASITVPDYMARQKAYLVIDIGGEGLVRINGKIVGAVSSRENSGWVNRREILFNQPFVGGETLDIEIEGAVDSAAFCDYAMAGEKYMEYTVKTAELITVDVSVESYMFDITTAFKTWECCEDEYVKSRIYNVMDASVHKLVFDMGNEKYAESVPEAAKTLKEGLGNIPYATPGEVIMAGHSHLDVAWLWTVKEITRKTARTFANNLALMDNYPTFKFTQSQAIVYDFMKKYYPDIFKRVKEKVKSGQWEIVGNAWVEADTNIASGESLIRQLLYGREFFLKEFGVTSDIYWLPDCFGFTWALPQIIKRSGMKYFITSKLSNNDTNEFPDSVFRWRSHSGDEVLAYMQKVHYQGEYDPAYILSCRKKNRQNDVTDVSFGMFGYGDGGGGCTFNMVEQGKRVESMPGLPKSKNGTAKEFFEKTEEFRDNLPVWDGEMYYENHRGTYTSQAFVKKNNRQGEILLRNAEMLSVFSGIEYPDEKLEKTWKLLLVNQFHDILPGTSIHEVFENTRKEYEEMQTAGKEIVCDAKQAIKSGISVSGDSVIVWNMLSSDVSGVVNADVPQGVVGIKNIKGEQLPFTLCPGQGNTAQFYADSVPGPGWAVFPLVYEDEKADTYKSDNVKAEKNGTDFILENEYLRVIIDKNGLISDIYDKENDRHVLSPEKNSNDDNIYQKGNLLTVSQDKPLHESAWNLEIDYTMKQWELTNAQNVEIIESSPISGTVRVFRSFNKSEIIQDIILEKFSRHLDFDTKVNWHEKEKVLKAVFPVDIRSRTVDCEIAHGSAEYPTHYNTSYDLAKFEFCAHRWIDLSQGDYGVSILNDCKYGHSVHDNIMTITLMRAPVCPDTTADMGVSTFKYSLYPHKGTWRDADTVKESHKLNNPLTGEFIKGSGGNDTECRFCSVSADNVVLDAVKKAQDGDGVIVRMYEAETKQSKVKVKLNLIYNRVTECNLMEVNEREMDCDDGTFEFEIRPNEVRSFRFSVKR